jgi:glutathione S-transferase
MSSRTSPSSPGDGCAWRTVSTGLASDALDTQIPGLIDGDLAVSQCIAVASYLAAKGGDKNGLLGKSKTDQAEVQQWAICAYTRAYDLRTC